MTKEELIKLLENDKNLMYKLYMAFILLENKIEIEYVDIKSIKPYKNNAKLHPKKQIDQIKKSIQQFGFDDPIGVWNNEIVEGHERYIACKQLKMKQIPIIRLDHLTDEERKAYTLAHNKLTMNSDFDVQLLNNELKSILNIDMSDFDFDYDSIEVDIEKELIEDDIPSLPDKPKSKLGEIYQLGNHRLMCGDSTNNKDVSKLMNGNIADMVLTDPPYNVNVSNSQGMTIENDNMDSNVFKDFINNAFNCLTNNLKEGGAFYIWYSDSESINFRTACINNNLLVKQCLIWVKNNFNLGRQDYKWQHEPCLYGWKEGASHYFIPEFNHPTIFDEKIDITKLKKEDLFNIVKQIKNMPSTIMYENKPLKNDLHPTMKPLKICANMIKNSSRKHESVLDLFGGSGSTLIACEQLDRICYIMEYDPRYADVIIKRWENLTGKKAKKIK